jgi:hypothetical protein
MTDESSQIRKAFEFLFHHRGDLPRWDLEKVTGPWDAGGEILGPKIDASDGRRQWYHVVVDLRPDEDLDDARSRALLLAKEEHRTYHPGHYVQ